MINREGEREEAWEMERGGRDEKDGEREGGGSGMDEGEGFLRWREEGHCPFPRLKSCDIMEMRESTFPLPVL